MFKKKVLTTSRRLQKASSKSQWIKNENVLYGKTRGVFTNPKSLKKRENLASPFVIFTRICKHGLQANLKKNRSISPFVVNNHRNHITQCQHRQLGKHNFPYFLHYRGNACRKPLLKRARVGNIFASDTFENYHLSKNCLNTHTRAKVTIKHNTNKSKKNCFKVLSNSNCWFFFAERKDELVMSELLLSPLPLCENISAGPSN